MTFSKFFSAVNVIMWTVFCH